MLEALVGAGVQVAKSMWWFFLIVLVVRWLKGVFNTRARLK